MKKAKTTIFSFIVMTVVGFSFVMTSASFAACPADIAAYWKLDEAAGPTYADFIGDNDGTGAVDPDAATGKVNGAQSFNGSTMSISVPASKTFNWLSTDSFTMEFWVKVTGGIPANNKGLLSRSGGGLFWFAGLESVNGHVTFELNDTGADSSTLEGSTDIATVSGWHHVAIVRDESTDTTHLYVDGNLEDSEMVNFGAGFSSETTALNIGRIEGFANSWFNGLIDEVAIYDRALPESEIDAHVAAGTDYCGGSAAPTDEAIFAPYPDNTISLWPLDEAGGSTYVDAFDDNDGTGAVDPDAVAGKVDGAQSFNGSTMSISVPASKTFNWLSTDSFTMEFWVKVTGGIPANNKGLLSRSGGGLFWFAGLESVNGHVTFELNDTGADSSTLEGSTDIATVSGWHHVAIVRDESTDTTHLYVDGNLEDSEMVNFGAGFSSETTALNIGRIEGFANSWFNGLIDEVAIYDRALPESEIDAHVAAGLDGDSVTSLRSSAPTTPPAAGGGGGGGGGGCFIDSLF